MKNRIQEAVDFMVEHAKDANWDALHRGVEELKKCFAEKAKDPEYQKQLENFYRAIKWGPESDREVERILREEWGIEVQLPPKYNYNE